MKGKNLEKACATQMTFTFIFSHKMKINDTFGER